MSGLAFFRSDRPWSLAAVAAESGAELAADADASRLVHTAVPLARACVDSVSVFHDGVSADDLRSTRAGACFVEMKDLGFVPDGTIALVTDRPREAFRRLASLMHPDSLRPASAVGNGQVESSARVHAEVRVEPGVVIDPGAIVGPGAEIGSGTFIGACAVVGAGVRIGRHCAIDAHASLVHALVGDRVSVGAGARIGQGERGTGEAAAFLGRVIIQNGVEIGPNAVIARGEAADTVVGEGCRVAALEHVVGGTVLVAESWRVPARTDLR